MAAVKLTVQPQVIQTVWVESAFSRLGTADQKYVLKTKQLKVKTKEKVLPFAFLARSQKAKQKMNWLVSLVIIVCPVFQAP